jgi:hypothetical protein
LKRLNPLFAFIFVFAFSAFASAISVQITSPSSGSTVSSPVRISAQASSAHRITGWWVYVDGAGVWSTGATPSISPSISISGGSHTVLVRAWNSTGAYSSAQVTLKVPTSTSTVSVSISPSSSTVKTSASAQFTASVTGTTNTTVTWLVSGVQGGNSTLGTISTAGLYTAPAVAPGANPVTVTARSVADSTKSASAAVTVTTTTTTSCTGTCYYVATNGSDSNPGTSTSPFRTIQHAANIVNPGNTVIVRDGTYNDSTKAGVGSKLITVSRSGTASAPITFKAEHKWLAVIDGLNNATAEGWSFAANYIRVQDFEVKGFSDDAFTTYGGGQFISIVGNHIHDMGRYCTNTGIGRDGIFLSSNNATVEQNTIHDIGRYVPGENGCSGAGFYDHNDHAIYIAGASNVTIRNNLFYRIKQGWSVHVYPSGVNNLAVLNNTFVYGNAYGYTGFIIFDNGGGGSTNFRIEDNIGYNAPGNLVHFVNTSGYTGTIARNITQNGTASDASPSGVTMSGNRDNTNPQLVSVGSSITDSTSVPDAHLLTGSVAIWAGIALADVTNDHESVVRPNPPSIGAFEYKP